MSIRLAEEDAAAVGAQARRWGVSMAAAVRAMVGSYIAVASASDVRASMAEEAAALRALEVRVAALEARRTAEASDARPEATAVTPAEPVAGAGEPGIVFDDDPVSERVTEQRPSRARTAHRPGKGLPLAPARELVAESEGTFELDPG